MRDKTQMRDGQEDGRDNVKSKESQFEKGGTKEDESEAKDSSQDKMKDQEEERYIIWGPTRENLFSGFRQSETQTRLLSYRD